MNGSCPEGSPIFLNLDQGSGQLSPSGQQHFGDCNMAADWKKAAAPYFPQLFIQGVEEGDIARTTSPFLACEAVQSGS